MKLTSASFRTDAEIPKLFTGEGKDRSPALHWTGTPAGTQELALICDDPDAPSPRPWVHWVIYDIPNNVTQLPEGLPPEDTLNTPVSAKQGLNSWKVIGYKGPMPPPGHGWHRYFFRLYALDKPLGLKPGLSKDQLIAAMKGHVLDEATLMGQYER